MNRRSISWVLAALLLLGLIENWRIVLWVFRVREPLGLLVGLTWLALVVSSVVGLFRVRKWGAYSLLVLAVFSTGMLSTSLFPGMHVAGLGGPLALTLWNLMAAIGGVLLLRTWDLSSHSKQPI